MESYKTSWYSEEPLDLSMKVNARPNKARQNNDSPLCMVKSCACALTVNEKQNDPSVLDDTADELSSDGSSKGQESEHFTMSEKSGLTTKEIRNSFQPAYSKKSRTPPAMYRRDSPHDVAITSRSERGESPPQAGRASPPLSYHEERAGPPSTSSGSQFTPVLYHAIKSSKYDMRQSVMSVIEKEYSDVHYERESSSREVPYYRSTTSPRAARHEYESTFSDRGIPKHYRPGTHREDEKTTFICMDTGKYYESNSARYRGSGPNSKRAASPRDQASALAASADSLIRGNLSSEEGKNPGEHILYSSRGAVGSAGNYTQVDPQVSEGQTMSVKYSTDAVTRDSSYLKQKENALWSPASGVCYKQYHAFMKRQFVPAGSELDVEDDDACFPAGGKKVCDQSDKNGCQNWLVNETNSSQGDRPVKTQYSPKNSNDWIPKFEIVPLTASTETKLSWSHGSSPFIVSRTNISDMLESNPEGQKEGDLVTEEKEGKGTDSETPLEHPNRKMCALDYLISKVLVERIDVPFKACNTEINRIYRGECKGRLRLVDLIELQVEASLKV
ncbi:uncharacterized protein LOC121366868 [Gigantopelta aegis]|uniref:uncharacterized protein LOC121366868 n=1 Tax=Gigantopelta aegis TaxID=1735272 RepID=UPI001B8880D4|nr:uncharacterized protein LOC121366868 [Gigantopelta aegis]